MKKTALILVTMILFLLLAVTACSSKIDPLTTSSNVDWGASETLATAQIVVGDDSHRNAPARWPDYIPDDIPELEGEIVRVWETGGLARIFYQNIKKNQLDEYLKLLKKKGFELEYRVYENPAYPESAKKRMKKGDYDDVKITKGDYSMTISYGSSDITYDIDTWSFQEAIPTAAALNWPAELSGFVPEIERCFINAVIPGAYDGYRIICQPEDEAVLTDYVQALTSQGFEPTTVSHIASLNTIYRKGEWLVLPNQTSTATLDLEVWREDELLWPAELSSIVPEPAACQITRLDNNEQGYFIDCKGERENVMADYAALLLSNGFSETSRSEFEDGQTRELWFKKDTWQVIVMIWDLNNPYNNLGITITH